MMALHDAATAPQDSKATLTRVEKRNGFIPNMFALLANSPSTLNGFAALLDENDRGTLSATERQIVQIAASMENEGVYCVAGHSKFSDAIGIPRKTICAIRDGQQLGDKRYQGLVDFTRAIMRTRGHISETDIANFEAAGFAKAQMIEVIAGIALKTITNYVASAFRLPLDEQFEPYAWVPTFARHYSRQYSSIAQDLCDAQ